VLTENFLLNVKARYLRDPSEELNPYVSPLLARLSADLAPALVITAECDPIRDGGRLYAKKLALAGVPVEHIEYSGMIHGFMSFHMILREAVDAMKYIGIFLDRN
jgi:acetyl esterase